MERTASGELVGQTIGGRYRIDAPLARGGMATVYLATDLRLERTVALKVLRPDLCADPDFLARFRREALATASLAHPNVVSVFDFEAGQGLAYLVLEYLPGVTLRKLMDRQRLTPSQALHITAAVLEALTAAHDAGLVHRDIKPENVLLGQRGAIKVVDFGLARALDDHEHKTRTGMIIGTPAYVSPEHVAGTGTGPASDIYSTGVLLFEMLTGSVPFTGESAFAVAYQHLNADIPRPSTRAPGLPTELDELVLGATARDPADRFPSAAAFLAELRRVQQLMPPPEPLEVEQAEERPTVVVDAALGDSDESGTKSIEPLPAESPTAPVRQQGARVPVIMIGLLTLIGGLSWAFFAGPLQRATVPEVVGLTLDQARAALAERELSLEVAATEYSETAAKDTVIRQSPAAGTGTFLRRPVEVITSLGPERYEVPDLRGQTVEQASEALTGTKLAVAEQSEVFDEEVEAGLVTGTDPPAGTVLKPRDPVTLLVSKGPAPRPVPEVLGKPADQARAALEAAGLAVQQSEDFSDTYGSGTVAALNPPPGTEVPKGTTVAMVVSKGPPPVAVPSVIDLKREEAIAKLEAAGFKVSVKAGIVTPLNRVYSQDPAPGQMRPRGSTVTITII